MFCIFPGLETTDGLLVECEELTDLDDKRELETVLQTAGLSMQEFSVIKEKMHKAGVIGIEIGKGNQECMSTIHADGRRTVAINAAVNFIFSHSDYCKQTKAKKAKSA